MVHASGAVSDGQRQRQRVALLDGDRLDELRTLVTNVFTRRDTGKTSSPSADRVARVSARMSRGSESGPSQVDHSSGSSNNGIRSCTAAKQGIAVVVMTEHDGTQSPVPGSRQIDQRPAIAIG